MLIAIYCCVAERRRKASRIGAECLSGGSRGIYSRVSSFVPPPFDFRLRTLRKREFVFADLVTSSARSWPSLQQEDQSTHLHVRPVVRLYSCDLHLAAA